MTGTEPRAESTSQDLSVRMRLPEERMLSAGPHAAQDAATIVIFGATGDLTWRKLVPALYELHLRRLLPERYTILGFARRDKDDEEFRNDVARAIEDKSEWEEFAKRIHYFRGNLDAPEDYRALAARIGEIDQSYDLPGNRLYYFATAPEFFGPMLNHLRDAGLVTACKDKCWTRVVIEKPFGHDLASARVLNEEVAAVLDEEQVYRIDHYLGKETVQNVLSFRFGNAIFEPLFNRRYVDHVQITVSETLGMEGRRGAYYEGSGAIRDMLQNHVLQLFTLIAMEPPTSMRAKDIHDEKARVLRSVVPFTSADVARRVVRGQYGPGQMDGEPARGYREEEGVAPDSATETYVAMRLAIDNWRWAGVPFLLRTGKRLPHKTTEISVQYRLPPLQLFTTVECVGDECDIARAHPNVLTFRIQPDEGISLTFSAKRPGPQWQLQPVEMDFDYGASYHRKLPEAYERLLLDVLRGDSTLFTRKDEVELAWELLDPVLRDWADHPPVEFPNYEAGSWGPAGARTLVEDIEGNWRNP